MIVAWINKGEDFDPERTTCLKSEGVFFKKKGDGSITIEFHQEGGMLKEAKKRVVFFISGDEELSFLTTVRRVPFTYCRSYR